MSQVQAQVIVYKQVHIPPLDLYCAEGRWQIGENYYMTNCESDTPDKALAKLREKLSQKNIKIGHINFLGEEK